MNVPLASTFVVVIHDVTIRQDRTNANVKKATETMEQTAYVRKAPFPKEVLKVNVSMNLMLYLFRYNAIRLNLSQLFLKINEGPGNVVRVVSLSVL